MMIYKIDNQHFNKLAHSMTANKEELQQILKDMTQTIT